MIISRPEARFARHAIHFMTQTQLLERCCQQPEAHLAVAAMNHYQAYLTGYQIVADTDEEDFDLVHFEKQLMTDYKLKKRWCSSRSALCFLTLVEGDPNSLHVYLKYRQQLAVRSESQTLANEHRKDWDLEELLSVRGAIRRRPKMYLGNDAGSGHVWSLISGARWAEKDHPRETGEGWATRFMREFQIKIEQCNPCSRGVPWHRTLWFNCLCAHDISLSGFFSCFTCFQSGGISDDGDDDDE